MNNATTNNTAVETNTRKATLENAANIGTAMTIQSKHAAIITARDNTDNPVFKLVLAAAATAHRSAVSDAAMKAVGLKEDVRTDYLFHVATLYTAALRYADACHGGTKKAVDGTRNSLFTEWKAYLSLLTGETVKAAGADEVLLVKAATRTIKGATAYSTYQKNDGTTGARISAGAASTAAASSVSFQKELERAAVDRLLGFDGIMSYNDAKATGTNNAGLRAAAIKLAEDGVELVKAAETTAA